MTNVLNAPSRFGLAACLMAGLNGGIAADAAVPSYQETRLSSEYHGEGAAFGDLNRDGHTDLVSGPFWFEGPHFKERHTYYSPNPKDANKNGYTNDNFLVFVADFNKDDWNDVFVVAFPGTAGHWYENPQGGDGHWAKHLVLDKIGNESPALTDLNGDGVLDLCCVRNGTFGIAQPKEDDPRSPWEFSPISENLKFSPFTHGLGIGDVNGDKRADVLTKDGFFQQPESFSLANLWEFHKFDFRPSRRLPFPGGSQIYAYDVDGDGDNDIIMSLVAHGYGLAWFEQAPDGNGKQIFIQHDLLPLDGSPGPHGFNFSQLHALELADISGDGLLDIVAGKCRFAHGPAGDPDPQGDPVLYGWVLQRDAGKVTFTPHRLSATAGVGRKFAIKDLDGDGRPEIAIGNKVGTTLLSPR